MIAVGRGDRETRRRGDKGKGKSPGAQRDPRDLRFQAGVAMMRRGRSWWAWRRPSTRPRV